MKNSFGMSNPEKVIEYRIGGWIEKALEISGNKDINVEITKSMTRVIKETLELQDHKAPRVKKVRKVIKETWDPPV
jgi:hypothetical protein